MSAKLIELYDYVKGGQASSLSCNVVYTGEYGTFIFSGFLSEDINFSVQSDFGTSMPSTGIKMLDQVAGMANKVVDVVSNAKNAIDGSGGIFNPINSRNLWNSTTPPSFSVELHLFTLSSSDDVIAKAQQALFLTSPRLEGAFLLSPGKYEFPANEAYGGHARNLWAIQMGNHFSSHYLICNNLSVTISKEHVRFNDPNDLGETSATKPLYITLKFDFITDRMRFAEEMVAMLNGGSVQVSQMQSGEVIQSKPITNPLSNFTNTNKPSNITTGQPIMDAGISLASTVGNAVKNIFTSKGSNSESINKSRGELAQDKAKQDAWNKGVG